jgi:soluble lytic murein transglycosylase-like protein
MDSWMKLKAGPLWRIAITAAALLQVPAYLAGQDVASTPEAHAATDQPFAGYQELLTRKADALLASIAEPGTVVGTDLKANREAGTNPALYGQPWGGGGLGAAAARVELLRPAVDPILQSHGVPAGIATAVMLVESGGHADALSIKGARGLWQLMPETARRYGLRVDDIEDDRLNLSKATEAAAHYLHDLYARFGDWRLALAAYNAGEGSVSIAILRAHSQDFFRLASLRMLPMETRQYVPRVLARENLMGPDVGNEESRMALKKTVFALNSQ